MSLLRKHYRLLYISVLALVILGAVFIITRERKYEVTPKGEESRISYSATIDFYLDSSDCHPKPYCGDVRYYGSVTGVDRNDRNFPLFTMENRQIMDKNTKKEKYISFWVAEQPIMVRKQLQPEGRLATIVFTEHPDGSSVNNVKAIYFGTSDEDSPDFMKKGFVGHGLKTSRGEWLMSLISFYGFAIYVLDPHTGEIVDYGDFEVHSPFADNKSEVDRMCEFVDAIPDGYLASVVLADTIPYAYRAEIWSAMESLGSGLIREVWAFDSWCLLGRKGARPGGVPEAHMRSRLNKDVGRARDAELRTALNSPPIRAHLISSGKHDNANVSMDIYKNAALVLPNDQPSTQASTGILCCRERKSVIDMLYEHGIEIGPHTIRPMNDLDTVESGLSYFKKQYHTRFWIDHGFNYEDLVRYGYKKDKGYYVLDKLENAGIEYAWNWWDMGYYIPSAADLDQDDYPFNMLYAQKNSYLPILFYQNNRMDHDGSDGKIITLYNASPLSYMHQTPLPYRQEVIDQLIKERGVHISHSYFTNDTGPFLVKDGDKRAIHPSLDESLKYIGEKVRDGSLWNPTLCQCGDYYKSMSKIDIIYLKTDQIVIQNRNAEDVRGFSLASWELQPQAVLLNGDRLVDNYKYVGDDLIFWFDISAHATKAITIVREKNQYKQNPFFAKQEDGTITIENRYYNAKVTEDGVLEVHSLNGKPLVRPKGLSAIYNIGKITTKKSKPEIILKKMDDEVLVSCLWQKMKYIWLQIDYKFYADIGKIDVHFKVVYKKTVEVEEEKYNLTIFPERIRILDHANTWVTADEDFTYPQWYPAFAQYGTGDESVYLYGKSNMAKTVIRGRHEYKR